MAFQDPKKRAEKELNDELVAAGLTDTGAQQPGAGSDTGTAQPAATDAPVQQQPGPAAPAQPVAAPNANLEIPELTDAEKLAALQVRFDTLNGKYRAEVPRLQNKVRLYEARIDDLNKQIVAKPATEDLSLEIDPESKDYKLLVDEYGDKAAKAVAAVAGQLAAKATQGVRDQVQAQAETVEQAAADNTVADFHSDIARLGGADWLVVNEDQGFSDWTYRLTDERTSKVFNTLLAEAYKAGDAEQVAWFFNQYRAATESPDNPQPQPRPDNANPIDADQQSMIAPENRATPNAANGDSSEPDKVWSMGEVDKFYDDVARGAYQGKETEMKDTEQQISVAMNSGRVID